MTDEQRALTAHLFRRAGFGARKADLDAFEGRDYTAAVEAMVNPDSKNRDAPNVVTQQAGGLSTPALSTIQEAWLQTMVNSRAPLVERMTLFLSNHFATAYDPSAHVDIAALLDQQTTIRKFALGSFADLARAMIDDKALACYLNNDRNDKTKPNENLARELMELFILGTGNYSEADVRETARALTGYTLVTPAFGQRPKLTYDKSRHDDGPKTILGVTANFTPHSVLELFLSQPAARQHLAEKLVAHFVAPTPDASLVSAVAAALAPDWQLSKALRTIFYSAQFRAAGARQSLAKTPAEYVVGIMRALGRTEYNEGNNAVSAAGQMLFRPPSVAGWPLGVRMLGPGAMLARYNAASTFGRNHAKNPSAVAPSGPELVPLIEAFGMTSLSQPTLDALNAYSDATMQQPAPVRTAGIITLLASSPEFNLA
ncbi:MAG: hypothetical protein QOJ00_1074 [Actinomycetota bacterium]